MLRFPQEILCFQKPFLPLEKKKHKKLKHPIEIFNHVHGNSTSENLFG